MIRITNKGEMARELFLSGYTCAQAVAGAFSDEIGMPRETVLRLALPFGGGMGRLREVCGTFSGMLFVVGAIYGDDLPKSPEKAKVYTIVQELAERFRAEYGTIVCRELLGAAGKDTNPACPSERTAEYYQKRPCADICAAAASILETYLNEHKAEVSQ